MEVLYPHCAGLDVHKDSVVACARHVANGTVTRVVATFKTTTQGLLALSAWLAEQGCTHAVMEATGVYWKPVWHILSDGDVVLTLANAAHVKNVPGRKTDANDATWLADLQAHGLIRASFVPDAVTQEQRGLLRTRKQLVRERASHVQRLQRTLEDANIKLDSVISDVMGVSGRAMIEALIAGQTDPEVLAGLAHRRLKVLPETLREALQGRVTRHHRFLLALHLKQIDALDTALGEIDAEVDTQIEPFRQMITLLKSIPGVGELGACVILAEIGHDMSRFATHGHLLSWAKLAKVPSTLVDGMPAEGGLCPRNDESAGKRRCTGLRKGAPWLKTTLIQCALGAVRKKGSYLQAQYHRLRARRGAKKAICAVAASMLTAAYHMLKDGTFYEDPGAEHFDQRTTQAKASSLVAKLKNLGYKVEIAQMAA
jgi:transposase